MPGRYRIRHAEISDLDALEVLENRVFSQDQLSRRSLRYYIVSPTASLLVLDEKGLVVGDAIVAFRKGTTVARLYSIAVAPDRAGLGLGRVLLRASEDAVRQHGRSLLRLEVRADNAAAIRFYDAAGYTRFGEYEDYYEDGTAALRYERRLT